MLSGPEEGGGEQNSSPKETKEVKHRGIMKNFSHSHAWELHHFEDEQRKKGRLLFAFVLLLFLDGISAE